MTVVDAEVTLIAISSNAVQSVYPIDDPVFSAHRPVVNTCGSTGCLGNGSANYTYYLGDTATGGVVGCVQQVVCFHLPHTLPYVLIRLKYQFCLPEDPGLGSVSSRCTVPTTSFNLSNVVDQLPEADDIQVSTIHAISRVTWPISNSFGSVRTLNASTSLDGGIQTRQLPPDQWVDEVRNWENFIYAGYQSVMADYGIGLQHQGLESSFLIPLTSRADLAVCQAQKMIKSGQFSNISVFGLAFAVGFAILVALLEIILLKFLIFTSYFRKSFIPGIDRWTQDGALQLQRRVYEAQGHNSWDRRDSEIPIMTGHYLFETLPLNGGRDTNVSRSSRSIDGQSTKIASTETKLQTTEQTDHPQLIGEEKDTTNIASE